MNDAYRMEIYKSLLFVTNAGFFGGIFYSVVEDFFHRIRGDQRRSFKDSVLMYVFSGSLYGLYAITVAGVAIESNSISMENIKNVTRFIIPLAILYPPISAALLKLIVKSR
jgi:hypothetical protein